MNTIDKISKEFIGITEYVKDVVKSNLATSALKNSLNESQLSSLIQVVESSINTGVQKAIPNFQKNIKIILSENTQPTAVVNKKK
jgi:hypothetical protein